MGIFSGVADVVKGGARIATAPLRTGLNVAGTTLTTGGNVLGNLANGNIGGAASAVGNGANEQVGNVTGYFKENVEGVKEIAGGHVEFLKGGANLIGAPVRGAARLAGAGLTTAGGALSAAGGARCPGGCDWDSSTPGPVGGGGGWPPGPIGEQWPPGGNTGPVFPPGGQWPPGPIGGGGQWPGGPMSGNDGIHPPDIYPTQGPNPFTRQPLSSLSGTC